GAQRRDSEHGADEDKGPAGTCHQPQFAHALLHPHALVGPATTRCGLMRYQHVGRRIAWLSDFLALTLDRDEQHGRDRDRSGRADRSTTSISNMRSIYSAD